MIWFVALQLALTPQQNYENATRHLAQLDMAGAEQDADAALQQDPYLVSALILKADLALFADQPEIARSCLIAAVVGHPSSPSAQLALGILYYGQGSFDRALPPLTEAHRLEPSDPRASLYLAQTYQALHQPIEAERSYQKAQAELPHSPAQAAPVLTAYGRFLSSLGRYTEAIEKERGAIKARTQSRDAHYELAQALDLNRSYKLAAAEAEEALTLPLPGVSDTQLHLLLQQIYLNLNERELAPLHGAKRPAPTAPATP